MIQVIESRTRAGATIKVALIPQHMAPGLECHYAASDLATANGCSHWRVVADDGRIIAAGKAHSNARYGSFGPEEWES